MLENKPRVLVVEDNQPLQMIIKDLLESDGYHVLTANDGIEALDVMVGDRPDLIVSDIAMPRMDGYSLFEAVRARREWVLIPFIFLTARGQKQDILKGKSLGVEDYLTKPFDPQELVIAVRSRLARARVLHDATELEFDDLKHKIITLLSHELRTPLTHIMGFTDLAMDEVSNLSPEELHEFLEAIKKGADRLALLVDDLLLLVQLDSGRMAEDFRRAASLQSCLGELVRRVVLSLEPEALEQGVELVVDVPSVLPMVRLHTTFFADALTRIIQNAIKFTYERGKRILVSVTAAGDWVDVTTEDEGAGIPASEIPRIFERFRQIGRDEMEQQGVGLGLPIAEGLVKLHGGDIQVHSVVGQGSTFTVRLPVGND